MSGVWCSQFSKSTCTLTQGHDLALVHSVVLFSKMAFLCNIIRTRTNWTLLCGIGLVNVFNKLIPGNGIISIKNLSFSSFVEVQNNRVTTYNTSTRTRCGAVEIPPAFGLELEHLIKCIWKAGLRLEQNEPHMILEFLRHKES